MIRRTYSSDKWLLTTQAEHARVAGLIAASWNYSGVRPVDDTFKAIHRHDDGWKDIDEAPGVSPAGAPQSFDEMDQLALLDIWDRSVSELVNDGKLYGAAIVANYYMEEARTKISIGRLRPRAAASVGQFMGRQKCVVARWKNSLNNRPSAISESDLSGTAARRRQAKENLDADTRLLEICDQLALMLCSDFSGEAELNNVPYLEEGKLFVTRRHDSFTMYLSPLPFAKGLRGLLSGVAVPRRIYESPEDLQATIKSAKQLQLEIHMGTDMGRAQTLF